MHCLLLLGWLLMSLLSGVDDETKDGLQQHTPMVIVELMCDEIGHV